MWKYTSYFKKGLSHEKAGTKCQDSVLVKEDDNCIIAALADGLGSLKHSDIAASIATNTVWREFSALGRTLLNLESDESRETLARTLLQEVSDQIHDNTADMDLSPSEMDCTLIFVYISKVHNYAITGRLGDSAICVIKNTESVAITESNHSANGTCAVLDKDAYAHMDISVWDIEADDVLGFILTSDGLDNELYQKGSLHVNQAAQDYFNALAVSSAPTQVIQKKIEALTASADSPFDDDISLAVLSRADSAISFPSDPTWLCSCGFRNRLQDTYCRKCGNDFSLLYQNVCFRDHGGRAAFFRKINQSPEEEAKFFQSDEAVKQEPKTVDAGKQCVHAQLPTESPMDPSKVSEPSPTAVLPSEEPLSQTDGIEAPVQQISCNKVQCIEPAPKPERHVLSSMKIPFIQIIPVLCLVLGIIFGCLFMKLSLDRDIRNLSERNAELKSEIDALLEEKLPHETAPTNPDEPTESETASTEETLGSEETTVPAEEEVTTPPETYPEDETTPEEITSTDTPDQLNNDILIDDDGNYYLGQFSDGLPHGYGMYWKNGFYLVGHFSQGKKEGEFMIVPENDPSNYRTVVYQEDEIKLEETNLQVYVVTKDNLNFRTQANLHDENVLAQLEVDEIVYKTSTPSVEHDGLEWVEVMYSDMIGWVALKFIEPAE